MLSNQLSLNRMKLYFGLGIAYSLLLYICYLVLVSPFYIPYFTGSGGAYRINSEGVSRDEYQHDWTYELLVYPVNDSGVLVYGEDFVLGNFMLLSITEEKFLHFAFLNLQVKKVLFSCTNELRTFSLYNWNYVQILYSHQFNCEYQLQLWEESVCCPFNYFVVPGMSELSVGGSANGMFRLAETHLNTSFVSFRGAISQFVFFGELRVLTFIDGQLAHLQNTYIVAYTGEVREWNSMGCGTGCVTEPQVCSSNHSSAPDCCHECLECLDTSGTKCKRLTTDPGWMCIDECGGESSRSYCDEKHCNMRGICHQLDVSSKFCVCRDDWSGEVCSFCGWRPCVMGDCLKNDIHCVLYGFCGKSDFQHLCSCWAGYTGATCNFNIDECESQPCLDGSCQDLVNEYMCQCGSGSTGLHCETDLDECGSDPCVNGTCQDLPNMFNCSCTDGFTGQHCQTNIDECVSQPCGVGHCQDLLDRYTCSCHTGFTGVNCNSSINNSSIHTISISKSTISNSTISNSTISNSTISNSTISNSIISNSTINNSTINKCSSDPCINGKCENLIDFFNCSCQEGFEGVTCETEVDECQSQPCVAGTCNDFVNRFICSCLGGFEGITCEAEVDECQSQPCVSGSCRDFVNYFNCSCMGGFTGIICEIEVDECASQPCVSGRCQDFVDYFMCSCLDAFEGMNCFNQINTCTSESCQCGSCQTSISGYTCSCELAMSSFVNHTDGMHCGTAPCMYRQCTDHFNMYDCTCDAGYKSVSCDLKIEYCSNAVSCERSTCDTNIETIVCDCDDGFSGRFCETDLNECLSEPCIYGECTDGVGSFTCQCKNGYSGLLCRDGFDEQNITRQELSAGTLEKTLSSRIFAEPSSEDATVSMPVYTKMPFSNESEILLLNHTAINHTKPVESNSAWAVLEDALAHLSFNSITEEQQSELLNTIVHLEDTQHLPDAVERLELIGDFVDATLELNMSLAVVTSLSPQISTIFEVISANLALSSYNGTAELIHTITRTSATVFHAIKLSLPSCKLATREQLSNVNRDIRRNMSNLLTTISKSLQVNEPEISVETEYLKATVGKFDLVTLVETNLTSDVGQVYFPESILNEEKSENNCLNMQLVFYRESPFWSTNASTLDNQPVVSLRAQACTEEDLPLSERSKRFLKSVLKALSRKYVLEITKPDMRDALQTIELTRSNTRDLVYLYNNVTGFTNVHIRLESLLPKELQVYIGINFLPTISNYSAYFLIPRLSVSKEITNSIFFAEDQLKADAIATLGIGIRENCKHTTVMCSKTVSFKYFIGSFRCSGWEDHKQRWTDLGKCELLKQNENSATLRPMQLRPITASFIVAPNAIDLDMIHHNLKKKVVESTYVFVTFFLFLVFYILVLIRLRYLDGKDRELWSLIELPDNSPSGSYMYELHIHTDRARDAGFNDVLYVDVHGTGGNLGKRKLIHPSRNSVNFYSGSQHGFLIAAQRSLGDVENVQLNFSKSAAKNLKWFLSLVVLVDVQTLKMYQFFHRDWITQRSLMPSNVPFPAELLVHNKEKFISRESSNPSGHHPNSGVEAFPNVDTDDVSAQTVRNKKDSTKRDVLPSEIPSLNEAVTNPIYNSFRIAEEIKLPEHLGPIVQDDASIVPHQELSPVANGDVSNNPKNTLSVKYTKSGAITDEGVQHGSQISNYSKVEFVHPSEIRRNALLEPRLNPDALDRKSVDIEIDLSHKVQSEDMTPPGVGIPLNHLETEEMHQQGRVEVGENGQGNVNDSTTLHTVSIQDGYLDVIQSDSSGKSFARKDSFAVKPDSGGKVYEKTTFDALDEADDSVYAELLSFELRDKVPQNSRLDLLKRNFFISVTAEHRWVAPFYRPIKSTYSRVQLWTVCVFAVTGYMLGSALWYDISRPSENDYLTIGGLKFSLESFVTVIYIVILVSLPSTLLIVLYDRTKVEPEQETRGLLSVAFLLQMKHGRVLPHFVNHITYALVGLFMLVTMVLCIMYSLQWGQELFQNWLISVFLNIVFDMVLLDPLSLTPFVLYRILVCAFDWDLSEYRILMSNNNRS